MPIAFNHRALTDRQMTPLAENAYNAQRFFSALPAAWVDPIYREYLP